MNFKTQNKQGLQKQQRKKFRDIFLNKS